MRSLPIILLAIWLVMGLFVRGWFDCNDLDPEASSVSASEQEEQMVKPEPSKQISFLKIVDGGDFSVSADEQIKFQHSSHEHTQPRHGSVTGALIKTAAYLMAHPEKAITLTGLYLADEKNNSALPNLGIARADNLKQVMAGLGVPKDKILTRAAKVSHINEAEGALIGAVQFMFSKSTTIDKRLVAIESELRKAPKRIYFQSNKEAILMNDDLRKYFDDLLYYLNRKPKESVIAVGHTDNRGNRNLNIVLGRGRADFIKTHLVKMGASPKQIVASSMGPDKPIATNNTATGRLQNRRVEITIK